METGIPGRGRRKREREKFFPRSIPSELAGIRVFYDEGTVALAWFEYPLSTESVPTEVTT
jgi:hypothetical protein